jgi:hypothetical protein
LDGFHHVSNRFRQRDQIRWVLSRKVSMHDVLCLMKLQNAMNWAGHSQARMTIAGKQ